jgi:hypothetical protein
MRGSRGARALAARRSRFDVDVSFGRGFGDGFLQYCWMPGSLRCEDLASWGAWPGASAEVDGPRVPEMDWLARGVPAGRFESGVSISVVRVELYYIIYIHTIYQVLPFSVLVVVRTTYIFEMVADTRNDNKRKNTKGAVHTSVRG